MLIVSSSLERVAPARARLRRTESSRAGPAPLRGFPFSVLASRAAVATATRVALRAQDAGELVRDVLGVAPRLSLRVLDRQDWPSHAEAAPYGVTHVAANGDLVVGASAADAWHDVSSHFARSLPARELTRLVAIHGVDSKNRRGPSLEALAESLIAHEVAHLLVAQQRIVFPSRWLEEAFANYVLVAALGDNDPVGMRLVGSLAEAARALDAGMPTLAEFERRFGRLDVVSSVLAELAITRAVYAAYATRHTASLAQLFAAVKTSADPDADWELGRMLGSRIHPSIASIPDAFAIGRVGLAA
jgi:hypothetical protein